MGRYRTSLQTGLSTVELLVTLLVASLFIASGFSLYTFVIQDSSTAKSETLAGTVANQYLEETLADFPYGSCDESTTNIDPGTIQGLTNVTVSVVVTCPNGEGESIARLTITVSYNSPQKTMKIARDVGPDSGESGSGSDEYNIGWSFPSSSAPTTPVFYWTAISSATSYDVEYRVNSGTWTAAPNTANTTYTYGGAEVFRNDTISLRVTAKNGGTVLSTSNVTTATVPAWNACVLQNNWTDYHASWGGAEFTKTSTGIVMMRGMVKAGTTGNGSSGVTICNLPAGFRPMNGSLCFLAPRSSTLSGVLCIDATTGNLQFWDEGYSAPGWESLAPIMFIASSTGWSTPTASAGWVNYGSGYSNVVYKSDAVGRTQVQGLAKSGSYTGYSTVAYTLPAGHAPSAADIYPSYACSATGGSFHINTSAQIIPRNLPTNTCWEVQGIIYPSTYTGVGGWQTVTPPAGWSNYGSGYSSAAYIKSSDGIVSLRGLIVNASNGETLFTLPAGYRPSKTLICRATTSGEVFARLDVGADGTVISREGTVAAWLSLAGCSFMAEQ